MLQQGVLSCDEGIDMARPLQSGGAVSTFVFHLSTLCLLVLHRRHM